MPPMRKEKKFSFLSGPLSLRASNSPFLVQIVFCTWRGTFRKRNTLVAFALRAGLLKLEIYLMFMHLAQYFWKEEYYCCFCTQRGAFRTRNTLDAYALGAVLVEIGILLLLLHFARGF